MTDAPEKIWLDWRPGLAITNGPLASAPRTEYIRADIHAAEVAKAIHKEREACAMVAARMALPIAGTPYSAGCGVVADAIRNRFTESEESKQ